ncbi:hypothetical protein C2S53_005538 [Perilla frutescens var. hirtella]|uniref:Uncharacterized protein n=1 Tax=Perilla frutescens var. hirtella TaxID=608512 RepID=A0AAD4JF41_PERFH|nr:hypothetical protein C2S51_020740 [Perilla frutescens var. frutescens]KAH6832189.1 hypothetical protein C2S53_005538 [Perilla frutescens var. hirtella]
MAEAVVSVVLKTIGDLVLEEGRLLFGVSDEVKALQTQLREIKCLLKDADRKQHESESVRNWMAEIRDLAYRAEDVIAAYTVQISSDGHGRRINRLLRRFSHVLNCYSLHQISSEISDIKSELARVTKNMQDYGIRSIIDGGENSAASNNQNWTRKTFPNFEIEDCFVGMEDELKQLTSLVVDDKHHRVISVWGMGGIGKTTIAKKVYNQMIQAKKFDCFAWVCITQQCQIRSVLEDVLQQLIPQNGVGVVSSLINAEQILQKREGVSSLSNTQLIEQLCDIQRAKRCLIVLDDLWETSHWDAFKHAFLVRDLKSKILVTTRKHKVADIGFSVELGLLNKDDAWELLKKKSFPHNNIPDFAFQVKLHKIGKEMIRKCGCLPLAICLLGGVLSNKNSMREWELVNENINASLFRGEGHDEKDKQIDGVLNLSYEDLPYYLKSCFLYLGTFEEDKSIYVYDLYRIWIAQGMISNENIRGKEGTLIDIAELYLGELASRCLVQVEVEDVIPTQKYRTCKLHDVVRQLCMSMGKAEDFGVQILEYQGGNFSTSLYEALSRTKTRHLAIHFKRELQLEDDELTIPCDEDTAKHLRSLEIHNDVYGENITFPPQSIVNFQKFKLLRSLVFVKFNFAGRKLPRAITFLVHLKCLRLRECDQLDKLPSSIRNLAHLDTLDLLGSWNVGIPNVLKKMFRLKHVLLPYYDKETITSYQYLRLDVGVDELESLIGFDSCVHELKSIIRMKNLRRLLASISDDESLSVVINAIARNWKKLTYCGVSIKQGCLLTSEEGLINLKRLFTCPDLHYLGISVQLGKLLADCMRDIISSKLVSLCLLKCEIEDDPMPILGKLPSLTELRLYSRSFVGEEMTCPEFCFPCLKKLELNSLPKLKEWTVEEGAMPLLSQLDIACCPCLEMVPDGFSAIFALQKLVISGMPDLGKRVLPSGDEFHKVRHVPSVIIY